MEASGGSGGSSWTPANPAPLGLAGFGLTTLVLSMFNANLVGSAGEPVVLGMALAYGGLCQLLAGIWEFRTGNTFGATAFSSYGAFWISFFFLVSFDVVKIPGTAVDSALGLYLWAWGIFTGYMFFCSFAAARAVSLVFLLLTATFIILGIGNSGGNASVIHLGGWVGIVTAAAALYTSCAEIMFAQYKRYVLPVFPPKPAQGQRPPLGRPDPGE